VCGESTVVGETRRTITAKGESKMEENPFQPLLRYIISHSFSKVKYFLSNYTNFYRFFQKIAFFISVYYRWEKDWLLLEEKLPFFSIGNPMIFFNTFRLS